MSKKIKIQIVTIMALVMVCMFGSMAVYAAVPSTTPVPDEETVAVEQVTADAQLLSTSSSKATDNVEEIAIGLGISLVLTLAVVYGIYRGYKHNGKTEPYPYDKKAPLELKISEDILIDTDVRRRKIERDNK